jgi:ribonuclease J
VTEEEFEDFATRVNAKAVHGGIFIKPEKFVYFLRCPNEKLIDKILPKGTINLIYSQWRGYLEEEHKTFCTDLINKLKDQKKVKFTLIHTSGHATLEELKELAKAINPRKIVPIHTDNPVKMKQVFTTFGFTDVEVWEDGKEYSL